MSTRREHRVRASPSLQLPSRAAAEIETPPQGSPDANAGGDSGNLGSVPGSGDSFAHAVVKQAARLRSAMWRGGERVRTPHHFASAGRSSALPLPAPGSTAAVRLLPGAPQHLRAWVAATQLHASSCSQQ